MKGKKGYKKTNKTKQPHTKTNTMQNCILPVRTAQANGFLDCLVPNPDIMRR